MQNPKQVIKKEPLKMMLLVLMLPTIGQVFSQSNYTYPIVDTKQVICYDTLQAISAPVTGEPFFGQNAQYAGYQPQCQDNDNGTVTDLLTGLMWQQNLLDEILTFPEAVADAATFNLAGSTDWRLPTINEIRQSVLPEVLIKTESSVKRHKIIIRQIISMPFLTADLS
jgi:hypothetical protein